MKVQEQAWKPERSETKTLQQLGREPPVGTVALLVLSGGYSSYRWQVVQEDGKVAV